MKALVARRKRTVRTEDPVRTHDGLDYAIRMELIISNRLAPIPPRIGELLALSGKKERVS